MNISTVLDSIANRLEAKGLLKEAYQLDIVSNQLEAMNKDASVLDFLMKIPGAKGIMQQAQRLKPAELLKQLGGTKNFDDIYNTAMQFLNQAKNPQQANTREAGMFSNMRDLKKGVMAVVLLTLLAGTANNLYAMSKESIKSKATQIEQTTGGGDPGSLVDLEKNIKEVIHPHIVKNPTQGNSMIITFEQTGQATQSDTLGVDLGLDSSLVENLKGISTEVPGGIDAIKNIIKDQTYKNLGSDANIVAFKKQLSDSYMEVSDFRELLDSHLDAIFK